MDAVALLPFVWTELLYLSTLIRLRSVTHAKALRVGSRGADFLRVPLFHLALAA